MTTLLLVYQPVWRGGLLWDDSGHVTKAELRSLHGLEQIWFHIGATQQYYPLLHSAFWLEHRLWGDATLGYHLVNIALHAMAAILVLLVLHRLEVPGAYLAAAIFALHPLQVESVAWITELKNTLSAVFYLGAMLSYLRFDRTRGNAWYGLALLLFVLCLLSKTVTATLPAALLVIFWWQRGRLSWKTDLWPLAPFFVVGAAGGMLTAWVERKLIGAEGEAFAFTLLQRGLIAGRVIWFYLGKLLWPADLVFIYPRWQISQAVWWQYLFPLAAAALLLALWKLRHRTRAPLAAVLFFIGTLFPVLGFLNVYPFVFSFVADHFQYLASLGIITLLSAGVALLVVRAEGWVRWTARCACIVLLAVLAVLSWRQSRIYADVETLYRTTLDRNPDCWLAHYNLGVLLAKRGQVDEAVAHYRKVVEIKPDYALAHNNLGLALLEKRQVAAAIACFQRALAADFNCAAAHSNLGLAYFRARRIAEANAECCKALELDPELPEAYHNLGLALHRQGQNQKAILRFTRALQLKPDYAEAHYELARVLSERGNLPEAVAHLREAARLRPENAMYANTAAWFLATCPEASLRNGPEAVSLARGAVDRSGGQAPVFFDTLAAAQAEAHLFAEAVQTARRGLTLADQQNDGPLADAIRRHLAIFESGSPLREMIPGSP